MSEEALATAHHVGSVFAACEGGALLAAFPDRYEHWCRSVGREQARVRLVDWLSRTGRFFQNFSAGIWNASANLIELEMPLRGLLVQIVNWSGDAPVPDAVTVAAQGVLPLFGASQRDPGGFAAFEAPTIPTPGRATDALESLEQELVDEGSEVRLLLESLRQGAGLDAILVSYRCGETIATAGCSSEQGPACGLTRIESDTTEHVSDLLEASDLYFSLGLRDDWAGVRLPGAHAMLVATGPTRQAVERLREPGLGHTLDSLLESFRSRVDRISSLPTPAPDDSSRTSR